MADSPRRQMEKVLAFKRNDPTMKSCAQYVLDHEHWLPLLKNRQAWFRDFVLLAVKYRIEFGIDDTKVPEIIQHMIDSGYLWDICNRIKNPKRVVHAVMTAVLSVQTSGYAPEFTLDAFMPVFRVIAEPVTNYGKVPFCLAEDEETMHPLVVEKLLTDPEATERLIQISNAGIKDAIIALSALDQGLSVPLLAGTL